MVAVVLFSTAVAARSDRVVALLVLVALVALVAVLALLACCVASVRPGTARDFVFRTTLPLVDPFKSYISCTFGCRLNQPLCNVLGRNTFSMTINIYLF